MVEYHYINRRQQVIPKSQQVEKYINLGQSGSFSASEIDKIENIKNHIASEYGMTDFNVSIGHNTVKDNFGEDEYDEYFIKIVGYRLETIEEMNNRISRIEKHNMQIQKEAEAKQDKLARQKEMMRIFDGCSLEELQAMGKIKP